MDTGLASKLAAVQRRLSELGSVVVAFSGGVDSALLLKLAVQTLGRDGVLAVTGRSPSLPQAELDGVGALAEALGARHEFIDTDEFSNPSYLANPTDRCYFCKTELYSKLAPLAAGRGYRAVLSGTNADDLEDFRPGLRAAEQQQVYSPLAEAGIGKAEVRKLAAELGLPIHDKPASPCLASRVPYGQPITPAKLRQIDQAETLLQELGFRECRVRHHETVARIEVPVDQIPRLVEPELRRVVEARLRELGFWYVTVDLSGFRSGSLNRGLPART